MDLILVLALVSLAAVACGPSLNPDDYPDPESLWAVSMEAYRAGDWDKAQLGFQRLMFELPPRDERQAETRYYVAECQLQQNQRLEAARQFRRVSDDFPRHRLAPDALGDQVFERLPCHLLQDQCRDIGIERRIDEAAARLYIRLYLFQGVHQRETLGNIRIAKTDGIKKRDRMVW